LSEYKEEIDKMRWSYSRLSSYQNCPYEFFLKYIVKAPDIYQEEGNFYAELGSYVHSILEMVFKGELSIDDAGTYYYEHYDENVFYTTKQSIMNKKYEACADYFAEVDFSWLKDFDILGVELECTTEIGGHSFVGYLDLVLRNKETGAIILMDHKSAAYPFSEKTGNLLKSHKKTFDGYKRQMYTYCKMTYERFGQYPETICWNHFAAGGKYAEIEFSLDDYMEAMGWIKESIEQIEREEEFPPNLNYFYCTQLCNFRNSCEYAADAVWK